MSTRRLAGSRRNKHLPIARAEHLRDIRKDGWPDRLAYPADYKRKPDHAARAVDIHTIWAMLPAGDTTRQLKAAIAGAPGKSAAPMTTSRRLSAYYSQRNGASLTARQSRQSARMSDRYARFEAA